MATTTTVSPTATAAMNSPVVPGRETSLLYTTKRGLATASFCLGLWGSLTFWMYPFGFFVCNAAIALGVISMLLGFRVGKGTEQLALWGVVLGGTGAGAAMTIYRFFQLAFEGSIPTMLP